MKKPIKFSAALLLFLGSIGAVAQSADDGAGPSSLAASCDSGDQKSCFDLGKLYQTGAGVGRNTTLANRLFAKACDAGHKGGCNELAEAYYRGIGVKKNYVLASRLTDRSCTLGEISESEGKSCERKSIMLANGHGTLQDFAQSYRYLDQACTLGRELSCLALAKSLRSGVLSTSKGAHKIPRDLVRARALASQVCKKKNAEACYEVAQLPSRDERDYAFHMALSCDYGSGRSCFDLTKALNSGRAESNPIEGVRSLEHYRARACNLKVKAACSYKSRAVLASEARERERQRIATVRKKEADQRERERQNARRLARWKRGDCGFLEFACEAYKERNGIGTRRSSSPQRASSSGPSTRTFSCKTECAAGLASEKDVFVDVTAKSKYDAEQYVKRNRTSICRKAGLASYNVLLVTSCK